MGVTLYAFGVPLGTPMSLMPFWNGSPCNPKGRPRSEDPKKVNVRFIQGGSKKVNPKAPREGRSHGKTQKRSTKVLSKAVLKKGPTKELEAQGGPWSGALIVVWKSPPKQAPKNVWRPPPMGPPPPQASLGSQWCFQSSTHGRTVRRMTLKFCIANGASFVQLLAKRTNDRVR